MYVLKGYYLDCAVNATNWPFTILCGTPPTITYLDCMAFNGTRGLLARTLEIRSNTGIAADLDSTATTAFGEVS